MGEPRVVPVPRRVIGRVLRRLVVPSSGLMVLGHGGRGLGHVSTVVSLVIWPDSVRSRIVVRVGEVRST